MNKTWQENLSAQLDALSYRMAGEQQPDDDPPAMPTIEAALARLEAESPAAATAARAYLEGTENVKTQWVRARVSVAEHARIHAKAEALGYASVSEFVRARVLE